MLDKRDVGEMRYRSSALVFAISCCLWAEALPAWWSHTCSQRHLDARFVQESQSSIFGSMKKSGRIQLSRPGKLKVAYEGGLILVSDGMDMVQYDPQTRTASRMDLEKSLQEVPILRLLMGSAPVQGKAKLEVLKNGAISLDPGKAGSPKVELQGEGHFLKRISWTDGTGAKQSLELMDIKTTAAPSSTFKLKLPGGTKWVGR